MKSLKESLFDDDLVTKDITFGSMFMFDGKEDGSATFMAWQKYLNPARIKKDSKVTGHSPNEIIYKGLLKLIKDIKFDGDNMTTDTFEDYLTKMIQPYYQNSLSDAYKHAVVQIYKNGRFLAGKEYYMLDRDFDEIQIFPCQTICFTFYRK